MPFEQLSSNSDTKYNAKKSGNLLQRTRRPNSINCVRGVVKTLTPLRIRLRDPEHKIPLLKILFYFTLLLALLFWLELGIVQTLYNYVITFLPPPPFFFLTPALVGNTTSRHPASSPPPLSLSLFLSTSLFFLSHFIISPTLSFSLSLSLSSLPLCALSHSLFLYLRHSFLCRTLSPLFSSIFFFPTLSSLSSPHPLSLSLSLSLLCPFTEMGRSHIGGQELCGEISCDVIICLEFEGSKQRARGDTERERYRERQRETARKRE